MDKLNDWIKKIIFKKIYLNYYPINSDIEASSICNDNRKEIIRLAKKSEFIVESGYTEIIYRIGRNIGTNFFTGNSYVKDIKQQRDLESELISKKNLFAKYLEISEKITYGEDLTAEQLNKLLYANRFKL